MGSICSLPPAIHFINAMRLTLLTIRRISILAFLLLLVLALHSCAPSNQILMISTEQANLAGKSQLRGVVTDFRTGKGIPGANIEFEDLRDDHNRRVGTAAGIHGEFVIMNIPPGKYTLAVSFIGSHSLRHSNLAFEPDQIVTVHYRIKENVVENLEVN